MLKSFDKWEKIYNFARRKNSINKRKNRLLMDEIKSIEFNNPLILHTSSCWECLSDGNYILNVSNPNINHLLEEDLDDFIDTYNASKAKNSRYQYGCIPPDYPTEDEMEAMREYWARIGFTCDDDEWEEYMSSMRGFADEVWPPTDEDYYDGNINYDPYSKKRMKKNKGNSIGCRSQKFINGIEVDDAEFEEYNTRMMGSESYYPHTRRGGKKHKKKGKKNKGRTNYGYNSWEENSTRPFDDCTESSFYDEIKKIVFYRDLKNTADTYEFNNLHDFNEWLDENGIDVDERDISSILYSEETHCCLNPESSDKILIVSRSYGDLVWTATDGDESTIEEINNDIVRKSMYV